MVEDEQLYNKVREAVSAIPMKIGFENVDGISEYVTKRVLVGYAIVRYIVKEKELENREYTKTFVKSNPVYQDGSSSNTYGVDTHIENEETVIGVVQPTRPTYGVFGLMPLDDLSLEQLASLSFSHFGEDMFLGFEYEGTEHPEWISMLREKWIEIIYEHEKERELWSEVKG
ncbi:hypothetical protein MSBR3_0766 [Methanosarcina barkeri 3]|uniref:Uncharacterized protein n=1 Tax=Methanosarcina barkeri 3 TaxID=1434107 RepID=A0A0E3SG39_METBA|nr:hypothetical protein [Methanosarcina barkeri]AKB81344.1 hypothetical protein MSBR3_0766 [Methanosarcina barkeri 3]